jgi:hypothetical protein
MAIYLGVLGGIFTLGYLCDMLTVYLVSDVPQSPRLVAFEHALPSGEADNIVLLVGGLGDGLLSIPFISKLSTSLPTKWTLVQALLTTAYKGWGTGSVAQDATELAACVSYFRSIKPGKIVIMGHSTGSQDVMEYLTGQNHKSFPPVDGSIIQAPVSDREGMQIFMEPGMYEKSVAMAQQMVDAGKGESILPLEAATNTFGSAVCARRWLSLASPNHDGDDDFFSSDLTDEQLAKTFGSLPSRTPMCILFMGNDEYVSPELDKQVLVDRWIAIAEAGGATIDKAQSGVVEGCTHALNKTSQEAIKDFGDRVHEFLKGLFPQAVL